MKVLVVLLLGVFLKEADSTREACCYFNDVGYTTMEGCFTEADKAEDGGSARFTIRGTCRTCGTNRCGSLRPVNVRDIEVTGVEDEENPSTWIVSNQEIDVNTISMSRISIISVDEENSVGNALILTGRFRMENVRLQSENVLPFKANMTYGKFTLRNSSVKHALLYFRGSSVQAYFTEVNFTESRVETGNRDRIRVRFERCRIVKNNYHDHSFIKFNVCDGNYLGFYRCDFSMNPNRKVPVIDVKSNCYNKLTKLQRTHSTVVITGNRFSVDMEQPSAAVIFPLIKVSPKRGAPYVTVGPIVHVGNNDFSKMFVGEDRGRAVEGAILEVTEEGTEGESNFVVKRAYNNVFNDAQYGKFDYIATFSCFNRDGKRPAFELISPNDRLAPPSKDGETEDVNCDGILAVESLPFNTHLRELQPFTIFQDGENVPEQKVNLTLYRQRFGSEHRGEAQWVEFMKENSEIYTWVLTYSLFHVPANEASILVLAASKRRDVLSKVRRLTNEMTDMNTTKRVLAVTKSRELATSYMRGSTYKGGIGTGTSLGKNSFKEKGCSTYLSTRSWCMTSQKGNLSIETFYVFNGVINSVLSTLIGGVLESNSNTVNDHGFSNNQVFTYGPNPLNELLQLEGDVKTVMKMYFDKKTSSPNKYLTILYSS